MNTFLGGVGLGGLVSWFITHMYFIKTGKDQKTLYNKLSNELRDLIISDKRDSLSVQDLNERIRGRVLDYNSNNTLSYKACPKCGSENIYNDIDYIPEVEEGDDGTLYQIGTPYDTIKCMECGWRDDEIKREINHIKE